MFDSTSRYFNLENASFTNKDGKKITYKKRRFLPQTTNTLSIATVTVVEGDRLDIIASRILGDPLSYWQIVDSNRVLKPQDLVNEPGRVIEIRQLALKGM